MSSPTERVLCACTHSIDTHAVPSFNAQGETVQRVASEVDIERPSGWDKLMTETWKIPRPCLALDCACPHFALSVKPGEYFPSPLGEDGLEIVRYEPAGGPERRCAISNCPIPAERDRYVVRLYPRTDGHDDDHDVDEEREAGHWGVREEQDTEFWDALDEEGADSALAAPPPRFTDVIACTNCVLDFAVTAAEILEDIRTGLLE